MKSALSRLVTSIEVHEDPRPGRKRPGAKLVVRGNPEALLTLTGKVTTGGSPGGTLTLLTSQLPPRCIHLNAGRHGRGLLGDQQRRGDLDARNNGDADPGVQTPGPSLPVAELRG